MLLGLGRGRGGGHRGHRGGGRHGGGYAPAPYVVYSEPYVIDTETAYEVDPQEADDSEDTNGFGAKSDVTFTDEEAGTIVGGTAPAKAPWYKSPLFLGLGTAAAIMLAVKYVPQRRRR